MKAVVEQGLIELVIDWVKENRLGSAVNHIEISEDTNLLESGLLDSFAFVDLILFIESRTGKKIDLIDVSPQQFTVVRGLCQLVHQNGRAGHADAAH